MVCAFTDERKVTVMEKSFSSKVMSDLSCGTLRVVDLDPDLHRLTDEAGTFAIRQLTILILEHQGVREVRLSGLLNSVMPFGGLASRSARFSSFPVQEARLAPWCAELIDEAATRFSDAVPVSRVLSLVVHAA